MEKLLSEIRKCTECEESLPFGCRPVLDASKSSKILIVGQAPGRIVHNTGIPWNDASGKNLRSWLDVDSDTFYDTSIMGIVPMGFCYPGTGKSGDLPPRKECAKLWHEPLLAKMPNIELILLIGAYAQKYYLKKTAKKNLTTTVQHFEEYLPLYFPLPHPSPRNNIWQKKNPWFKEEVLPFLKERVAKLIV
ncbi:MAG: uracil-DNA glycosylase family 4 [Maribacter sp.]|jgi:uracil-DNA glycosylase family 4